MGDLYHFLNHLSQSDFFYMLKPNENSIVGKGKAIKVEGYLFKRGQNAFRTWNRRWFYLSSNKVSGEVFSCCWYHFLLSFQLCYSKRNGEDVTVIEDDLRICLVRPLTDIDRRFCFEVISPTKSHVLQVIEDLLCWGPNPLNCSTVINAD